MGLFLEEYIKTNHPNIMDEYNRYLQREKLPQIGDMVITLCAGFGSLDSVPLKVHNISKNGITLINYSGDKYWVPLDKWYLRIRVE